VYENKLFEKTILDLADNMAAAASSFSSHGYDAFIQARDNFKDVLHNLVSEEEEEETKKS
jgi:hypothetical protein